jgi:hypothetical protein
MQPGQLHLRLAYLTRIRANNAPRPHAFRGHLASPHPKFNEAHQQFLDVVPLVPHHAKSLVESTPELSEFSA